MSSKGLPFTRIDELISRSLKSLNLEHTFKVYPIWKKWRELVGETIAEKALPDSLRGGVLHVSVETSVWMNELILQKSTLIQKIKEHLPEVPLEDIRFRLKK